MEFKISIDPVLVWKELKQSRELIRVKSRFSGTIEPKNKLEFIYKALQNNNTKIDLTW